MLAAVAEDDELRVAVGIAPDDRGEPFGRQWEVGLLVADPPVRQGHEADRRVGGSLAGIRDRGAFGVRHAGTLSCARDRSARPARRMPASRSAPDVAPTASSGARSGGNVPMRAKRLLRILASGIATAPAAAARICWPPSLVVRAAASSETARRSSPPARDEAGGFRPRVGGQRSREQVVAGRRQSGPEAGDSSGDCRRLCRVTVRQRGSRAQRGRASG